jgi:hypothetical protein
MRTSPTIWNLISYQLRAQNLRFGSGSCNQNETAFRCARLRHSLYPIRKAVPSFTIGRSTVSALREEIQRKPMASPVSLALVTPASGETR